MQTSHHTQLFAANATGAGWWLVDAFLRYGPSWQLVPPICIGLASLLGAVRSYQDGAHARRLAEEAHKADLEAKARRRRFDPLYDGLEGRN